MVLADGPVYTMRNGAVVISTGKPQTRCLRTGQGDYLDNYKWDLARMRCKCWRRESFTNNRGVSKQNKLLD